MVILTALIRALRQRFDTQIDVACGGWLRPLLEGQPDVGRIYSLYTRQLPYALNPQQWLFVQRLRARGPGPVWICQTDQVSHELVRRAGYDPRWFVSQRDFPPIPGHYVDCLLRMAMATPPMLDQTRASVMAPRVAPKLLAQPKWRDEARTWLAQRGLERRPIILIQAGNKRTMRLGSRRRLRNKKYWPEQRWAEVIDRIHALSPNAAILLLGVAFESQLNRAILHHVRTSTAFDVAGDIPMQRLIALCEQAIGMISVDTGPAHVAAAVGCPLVVMFGCQDPNFYAPRSETGPVEVISGDRTADHPLLAITPDAVLAAWDRVRTHSVGGDSEIGNQTLEQGRPASGERTCCLRPLSS
jgi:heptosyltransferase-2/heptosyltransferase-3